MLMKNELISIQKSNQIFVYSYVINSNGTIRGFLITRTVILFHSSKDLWFFARPTFPLDFWSWIEFENQKQTG